MYRVFGFATPNCVKVVILLEELALPYELIPVNIRLGEQHSVLFRAINPNGLVPVLVDHGVDGRPFVLTESAAILVYLAEKHGRFMPADLPGRARLFEQLFFHASALSPAFKHAGYFRKLAPEPQPFAVERFHGEAFRVLGVLERTLAAQAHVAGPEYTIADIAHLGWMLRRAFAGVDLDHVPHVAEWFGRLSARPAVVRAVARMDALAVLGGDAIGALQGTRGGRGGATD